MPSLVAVIIVVDIIATTIAIIMRIMITIIVTISVTDFICTIYIKNNDDLHIMNVIGVNDPLEDTTIHDERH